MPPQYRNRPMVAFRRGDAYLGRVKLADAIDLEAQLAIDEGADPAALHNRDRSIYLAMQPAPEGTEATLQAWLAALRARLSAPQLGARVMAGQRLLSYILVALALASGWGTAELLLAFHEGGSPVNVGHFLLTVVFGQLALVLLLVVGLGLRALLRARSGPPVLPIAGDLSRLLGALTRRLETAARDRLQGVAEAERETISAAYHRVRTRTGIYSTLERYLLLNLTQLFGVAFNLGVLASCLRLILFSDLAFSWSTSVAALDAAAVHRACARLAIPFAVLSPDAVPSMSLVEHTQYFRLEGRFAGAVPGSKGDAALVGEWWRFLVACTLTYGLLPRVLLLGYFRIQLHRAESAIPLDTPQVQRVLRRLTSPELSTRAVEWSQQGAEPSHVVGSAQLTADGETSLIRYRDLPTDDSILAAAITQDLGLTVGQRHRAGGLDVQADVELCATLGVRGQPVTLVAEAWEAPDRSLRGFLARLREALGPRTVLRVALVGEASERGFTVADPQDVQVFRDRLTLLEDAYLAVDVLTPPAVASDQAAFEGRA